MWLKPEHTQVRMQLMQKTILATRLSFNPNLKQQNRSVGTKHKECLLQILAIFANRRS